MTLHPNRTVMHKYMGTEDSCDRCHGRGWHYEATPDSYEDPNVVDYYEVYCECECGVKRKELETCTTDRAAER